MATRIKTVEFPFAMRTTSLAAATRHDFAAITLDIPENTSRTFLSVYVEVTVHENLTTQTNMTSEMIGIKLGATAFNDSTLSDTFWDSAAMRMYKFTRDVTSYFNTNFGSGTSQTCQVGVSYGGISTQAHTAKVICTYQYDDTSQTTRVKTIKIPFDGSTGLQSATLTEIGTNQVPILTGSSGILPEDTISVKQMWFEIYGVESAQAVTDFNLAVSLDAESEVSLGTLEMAKTQSCNWFGLWVRNDMTTTSAHAFKARTTTANRMSNLSVVLCITYTYNHDNTTSVFNSLEMNMPMLADYLALGDTSTDLYRSQFKFFVEESTITLKQSGVLVTWNGGPSASTSTNQLRIGGQSFRAYTCTPNISADDPSKWVLTQRIDSGGAQGAGVSIARGENTCTVDFYNSSGTANTFGGVTCYLILNYTSDKHANGADVHNKTIKMLVGSTTAMTNRMVSFSAYAANIPETTYYINNFGYRLINIAGGHIPIFLDIELLSGEDGADGWLSAWGTPDLGSEAFTSEHFIDCTKYFDRNPSEVDTKRLAIEGSRKYRVGTTFNAAFYSDEVWVSLVNTFTYHNITSTIGGYVSGYTGAGSGITVNAYREDTKEFVGTATTSSGGGFSITWYDNVLNYFCEARQDSTHFGRSDNKAAV
jgi:hypothetical protein